MNRILTESLPMPPSLILITWCLSKRAHQFGAANWSKERKRAYANDLDDPDTLIAVDRRLNRQKGAKDPAEWLPPNQAYQAEYARAWVAVKLKWGLTADPADDGKGMQWCDQSFQCQLANSTIVSGKTEEYEQVMILNKYCQFRIQKQ